MSSSDGRSDVAPRRRMDSIALSRLETKIDSLTAEIAELKLVMARLSRIHALDDVVQEMRLQQAKLLDRDEARTQREADVEQRIRELHQHTIKLVAWATLAGALGGGGTVAGAARLFGG